MGVLGLPLLGQWLQESASTVVQHVHSMYPQWPRGGNNPHVQVNKMWSSHTMEYYSALKRKGILTAAITWMSLEDIELSGISRTQKDKYCTILRMWGSLEWSNKAESRTAWQRAWDG